MIKHLTWISAWSEARREARVKPTEAERGRGYSSRNFFFSPSVFYFYLENRPASPYKLPFVPLISPRPLARTYLIRINARAAWKLASKSVRARHPACRSPSHPYYSSVSFPCPFLTSLPEITWSCKVRKPESFVRVYTNELGRREREKDRASLKLGILIRQRSSYRNIFNDDLLLVSCLHTRSMCKLVELSS